MLDEHRTIPLGPDAWFRLGFDQSDLAEGGSDRLIDALFGWGPDALDRVRQHREAGADHVCVQPISRPGRSPLEELRVIARDLF